MNSLVIVAGLVLAFATAVFTTPYVRRLALNVGMLDATGERRMHDQPKPRIGGIAVYLGFAFALFSALGYLINTHHVDDVGKVHDIVNSIVGLIFGGTLILMVGIWDDVMGMSPRVKLLAQGVVASISMLYGFNIAFVQNPFHHGEIIYLPLYISIPVTLLWYLGMMNAINFIDGLDGLLSGLTAIAGMFLLIINLSQGHPEIALILAALVGGALGFLPFNYNPAKIILGDSGALFIGYVFATVSILGASKVAFTISLLVPLVLLGLPVLDTAAAIVRRTAAGRKIYEADRGHFHHQLIFRFGLNVRQAVLLIYALCIALGVVALFLSGGVGTLKLA
ncbi:undecaprenyl-phosphate alpha-N-acetylglucosaminyl 1-phosphate transferase [Vulcanimicrobium alpinum]|uniref:Undecaprenyl-phosphate alpha-N-acetylglucosaminyl 1-phosphate transferase n=1 Tax=Vulcanimicrobium alpinum TaxID=3016050 RepID=A0AAN1Y0K1_UNVUL|nr:MraY family glycosyltransferase [Vulcanimicrobium alpinum]BDE08168.1 undecaprenyl-phosphate alpha-N-acetylglucosaminyl 1-phosphate transferase [Vulcanimicrobium alpinum]